MKTISIICITVLSLLFAYKPVQSENEYKTLVYKKDLIAPELLECKAYHDKIQENLNKAKNEKRN